MLKENLKKREWGKTLNLPRSNYVFGKPLVYFNKSKNKIDLVYAAWENLLNNKDVKNKVQPLSFKYLRKTGADLIKEIAGSEIAQLYLSHSKTTIADKHYINPDFPKLFDALQKMRKRLSLMFDYNPSEEIMVSPLANNPMFTE